MVVPICAERGGVRVGVGGVGGRGRVLSNFGSRRIGRIIMDGDAEEYYVVPEDAVYLWGFSVGVGYFCRP